MDVELPENAKELGRARPSDTPAFLGAEQSCCMSWCPRPAWSLSWSIRITLIVESNVKAVQDAARRSGNKCMS